MKHGFQGKALDARIGVDSSADSSVVTIVGAVEARSLERFFKCSFAVAHYYIFIPMA
jgi:hypothetical protein